MEEKSEERECRKKYKKKGEIILRKNVCWRARGYTAAPETNQVIMKIGINLRHPSSLFYNCLELQQSYLSYQCQQERNLIYFINSCKNVFEVVTNWPWYNQVI